jgi:hypothetical protein
MFARRDPAVREEVPRTSGHRSAGLDVAMPRLSTAANHSALWQALAAGLTRPSENLGATLSGTDRRR